MNKILIVSKTWTHPTNKGNSYAVLAQCRAFQMLGCDVHFLYIDERSIHESDAIQTPYNNAIRLMSEYWSEKLHVFRVSRMTKLWLIAKSFYRSKICHWEQRIDDTYPIGLSKFVRHLNRRFNFDICIVNYYYLSKLLVDVNFPKTAIHTHDCFAYKNIKVGEVTFYITAHSEALAMQRTKHIFALQDKEANYFSLISPLSKVYTIYSLYDYHPQPIVGNKNVCFFSGVNSFNVNGIRWFVKNIWNNVVKVHPEAKLFIGGTICNSIEDLNTSKGIELVGPVDEPGDFYKKADVAINPVFQGTGLKIKTFESICYDKVTIVHPHSTEGVFRHFNTPLLVSEEPNDWIHFFDTVWSDKNKILEIKKKNREYIQSMNIYVMSEYKRFLEA